MITSKDIQNILVSRAPEYTATELNDHEALSAQNVGSLLFVDLIIAVENTYNVTIPTKMMSTLRSLSDFANFVNEAQHGQGS